MDKEYERRARFDAPCKNKFYFVPKYCRLYSLFWRAFNVIAAVASHIVDSFYTFCCRCGRDFIATTSVKKGTKERWRKQATTKENRISSASKRWQRWIVEKCRLAISMWVFFSSLHSPNQQFKYGNRIGDEACWEKWKYYENSSRKAKHKTIGMQFSQSNWIYFNYFEIFGRLVRTFWIVRHICTTAWCDATEWMNAECAVSLCSRFKHIVYCQFQ